MKLFFKLLIIFYCLFFIFSKDLLIKFDAKHPIDYTLLNSKNSHSFIHQIYFRNYSLNSGITPKYKLFAKLI